MDYYGPVWGFGSTFEAQLATGIGSFLEGYCPRYDLLDCVWDGSGSLLGCIAACGRESHPDTVRLRWFVTAPSARGAGLGRQLLNTALKFCRDAGYRSVWLTTFDGLDVAQHLYETAGFQAVSKTSEDQWSGGVIEKRYELSLVGVG